MKGLIPIVFFVLAGIPLFGNTSDTTVTSFEIYLRRQSPDSPLGFNTCNIDRSHIYDLVIDKIGRKIDSKNFQSIHKPLVIMKFHDVSGRTRHNKTEVAEAVKQSMKGHQYNYFIKIYGHLDIDKPLTRNQTATFTLKVYVFDSAGNLVAKSKSRSRDKNLAAFQQNINAENYPLNEQEFFELVTDAADTIDLGKLPPAEHTPPVISASLLPLVK
jgi:hypothetical protein